MQEEVHVEVIGDCRVVIRDPRSSRSIMRIFRVYSPSVADADDTAARNCLGVHRDISLRVLIIHRITRGRIWAIDPCLR